MLTLKLGLTSNGPALMSSDRMANPLHPTTQALAKVTGLKKKTEDDHREILRLKYLGALYCDDQGPYWPPPNFRASLIQSARKSRQGKDIETGVFVLEDKLYLDYAGPKDPDALWADERFVDIRSGVLQGKRVMACRPIFHEWSCEATLAYDDTIIDRDVLVHIAERAGFIARLGTYRSVFGRYDVKVLEEGVFSDAA